MWIYWFIFDIFMTSMVIDTADNMWQSLEHERSFLSAQFHHETIARSTAEWEVAQENLLQAKRVLGKLHPKHQNELEQAHEILQHDIQFQLNFNADLLETYPKVDLLNPLLQPCFTHHKQSTPSSIPDLPNWVVKRCRDASL